MRLTTALVGLGAALLGALAVEEWRLQRARAAAADWAGLTVYREANRRLGPPTADRVVFIGDSIVAWWAFAGVVNRGIPGQTTGQVLARFRADALDLQPRAVVVLAGTNDIGQDVPLDVTLGNYQSMAELAAVHGVRLVLVSVLPVYPVALGRPRPPERILELNRWLREYAGRQGLAYADCHAAMLDGEGVLRRELSDDGLHPNAAGYAVMAPIVAEALRR